MARRLPCANSCAGLGRFCLLCLSLPRFPRFPSVSLSFPQFPLQCGESRFKNHPGGDSHEIDETDAAELSVGNRNRASAWIRVGAIQSILFPRRQSHRRRRLRRAFYGQPGPCLGAGSRQPLRYCRNTIDAGWHRLRPRRSARYPAVALDSAWRAATLTISSDRRVAARDTDPQSQRGIRGLDRRQRHLRQRLCRRCGLDLCQPAASEHHHGRD